jgi:hypothetical protein
MLRAIISNDVAVNFVKPGQLRWVFDSDNIAITSASRYGNHDHDFLQPGPSADFQGVAT